MNSNTQTIVNKDKLATFLPPGTKVLLNYSEGAIDATRDKKHALEIWYNISDYEGFYQVSNFHRIKSLERKIECSNNRTMRIRQRILKDKFSSEEKIVSLSKFGIKRSYSIYTLFKKAVII